MHFSCQIAPAISLYLYHLRLVFLSISVSLNEVCIVDIDGLPTLLLQTILPKVFVICVFRLIVATCISHFER